MRSRAVERRAGKGIGAIKGKDSKTFASLVSVTYENTDRGGGLNLQCV